MIKVIWATSVLFSLTAASVFAAEESPKSGAAQGQQILAKIPEDFRQKLQEPVDVSFKDLSLMDALKELGQKSGIDFWIDTTTLGEEGLNTDQIKLTLDLKQVAVRGVLKRILNPQKLSWVCDETGIMITTQSVAHSTTFARVYDITELLTKPDEENEDTADAMLKHSASRQTEHPQRLVSRRITVRPILRQFGGLTTAPDNSAPPASSSGTANPVEADTKNSSELAIQNLIATIMVSTGGPPHSHWLESDGEGGSIRIISTTNVKLLVIRQNETVHADIEDLLNELLTHHHGLPDEEDASPPPQGTTASVSQ